MATVTDAERTSLLRMLADQRGFLRHTVEGLDDERATRRTTASELTLAGLVKHVTQVEENWMRFVVDGPPTEPIDYEDPSAHVEHERGFRLLDGETLEGALAEYDRVAAETDRLVLSLPDLESSHPLPDAPWFEGGASYSVRDVLLHILRETAQHCGHADIIRESLDGRKTMG
ncbi:DinB family protein [Nocardiopsis lambiniae]|uniref:DinB family protein n=1 Tax=Nocardiopsis lambiniae TaxID=3075539 RepID=A0ABU2M5S4_9ACTN|nr:DinB family protein [Nocardiopsis sp. DSM 44743]MDT0328005.1 DinB family protein [Nocardiopsis sp. DSM 44743]